MCKAKYYADQLVNMYDEIAVEYDKYIEELKQVDLEIQDVLHFIENGKFNVVQGYDFAKQIQILRQKRRHVKNEIEPLQSLIEGYIKKNQDHLKRVRGNIRKKDEKLQELVENKVYNPRVLKSIK